jgi:hypothetical protein
MSDPKRHHLIAQPSEPAAVIPLLRDRPFDPDTISLMSATIEKICGELGVKAQSAAGEIVAGKIIELVQRGVKNPTALYLAAMSAFNLAN